MGRGTQAGIGIAILCAAMIAQAELPVVHYTPNPLDTTPFGPAKADILLRPNNFLPCQGAAISLCYYSGMASSNPGLPTERDLSCTLTDDTDFANCRCIHVPPGTPYQVDINAILDLDLYLKTVKICGSDGTRCQRYPNLAPVCRAINKNSMFDAAHSISTFSSALDAIADPDSPYHIAPTQCPATSGETALYAGCMTAPCVPDTGADPIVIEGSSYSIDRCACPTYDGRYQVGTAISTDDCVLYDGEPETGENVWSAAYSPLEDVADGNAILPGNNCTPDLPASMGGCPILQPIAGSDPVEAYLPTPPTNVRCASVCREYRRSRAGSDDGIEVGYTCDATLCTAPEQLHLVSEACSGLNNRRSSIRKIAQLEMQMGCSCCASQICGCEASDDTQAKVFELNAAQEVLGIETQCASNGTLCGEAP